MEVDIDTSEIQLGLEKLEDLLQEKIAPEDPGIIDALQKLCNRISLLDTQSPDQLNLMNKIESSAVSLWNYAVVKKNSGFLSASLNAYLRNTACSLVYKVGGYKKNEGNQQKQLMMALKTTRAWLDASEPSKTEEPLSIAMEMYGSLKVSMGSGGGDKADRKALESMFFKILCYKAEAACLQGESQDGLHEIAKAKELLHFIPEESGYLSMLCYNFGVDCYKNRDFEGSVLWLRESYELGKSTPDISASNQARTLRIMANAYLDWNSKEHWQKAMNAAGLANTEFPHPVGMFLKLRVSLISKKVDAEEIVQCTTAMLKHPELSPDLGLNTVRLLLEFGRKSEAFDMLAKLEQGLRQSPDHGKMYVNHLELLLQFKQQKESTELIEKIITEHNTGKQLEPGCLKRLQIVIWEQAANYYEEADYASALQWYNYSLSLCGETGTEDRNLAKLNRNRASCYIELHQLKNAEEANRKALQVDPQSCHAQYLRFRIALCKGDEDEATESLTALCAAAKSEENVENSKLNQGIISLAAQLALEEQKSELAVKALESLTLKNADMKQVLTTLRCLTRLQLVRITEKENKSEEIQAIIGYIERVLEKIHEKENPHLEVIHYKEDLSWFMKIAWNTALECEDMLEPMYKFFLLCSELCSMVSTDLAGLVRQKTCHLMATAASLQLAKQCVPSEKTQLYNRALTHVAECHAVCEKIENMKMHAEPPAEPQKQDNTALLLMLYEFEAKARLGDPKLDRLLEKVITMPNTDAKMFESIAVLAMDIKDIAMRALKVAVRKHFQADQPNIKQLSHTFQTLIQMALEGTNNSEPSSLQEAYGYFKDALNVIQNKAQGNYPEVEVLWLMTKAWNSGVHFFSAGKYKAAGQWCELGMQLLNHLGPLQQNYRTKMSTVYSEIMDKINDAKAAMMDS